MSRQNRCRTTRSASGWPPFAPGLSVGGIGGYSRKERRIEERPAKRAGCWTKPAQIRRCSLTLVEGGVRLTGGRSASRCLMAARWIRTGLRKAKPAASH
jgi:hypothetical protein